MDRARFEQLTDLYQRAREQDPAARAALLEQRCGADAGLRAELERMLAVDQEAPDFLDHPAAAAPPPAAATERIGPYRVVRVLGAAGMGVVYEAVQDNPARRVALKMMRFGFGSESLARRFRYEVEVLAQLSHPGIAHVHEAGVHTGPGGVELPWFAMELVEGATDLSDHARRERLSPDARLELFLAVCAAVTHGHQHGVVHRDLKPANVLVGADGRPKVIDFGVARAVGEDEARSQATRTGELVGTLTRMSPEQLSGDRGLVDMRTDVYALGLMLYELLCGRLPYDVEGRSWTEVARVIRDQPPLEPHLADPAVPRDLGWVVLRALEKERERRYASVSELAADLERFRRDEPVLAGPPSGAYRARKFLRRHRLAVGAGAAVALALVGGATAATVGMVRARDAEAAAREEAARALTMKELATGVFLSVSASERGADVRLLDVLREAGLQSERLVGQPRIEAEFRAMLGGSLLSLAEYGGAREHLARAAELCRGLYGPDAPHTLDNERALATALVGLGRRDEGIQLIDDVIARSERALGPDHATTLRARGVRALGCSAPGSPGRTEALQALAPKLQAEFGADDPQTLGVARELAFELVDRRRYDEALARLDALLEGLEAQLPEDDPRLLDALYDRAIVRRLAGDLPGAERDLDRLDPLQARRIGPRSVETGQLAIEHAKVKRFLDHHEEAEAIVRGELERRAPLTGDADQVTALLLFELGVLLWERGALDESEETLWRAIEGGAAVFGEDDIRTLVSRSALAQTWWAMERGDDAVALLEEVVEATERAYGPDSRMLVEFLQMLGNYVAERDATAALSLAERAARIARATLPAPDGARASAVSLEGQLLAQCGHPERAEPVLPELLETLPQLAANDETRADALRALVEIYEARGDAEAAGRLRALQEVE